MKDVTNRFHVPTPEEARVIEMAARRAQAEEMRRLAVLAARNLKKLVVKAAEAFSRIRRRPRTAVGHGA